MNRRRFQSGDAPAAPSRRWTAAPARKPTESTLTTPRNGARRARQRGLSAVYRRAHAFSAGFAVTLACWHSCSNRNGRSGPASRRVHCIAAPLGAAVCRREWCFAGSIRADGWFLLPAKTAEAFLRSTDSALPEPLPKNRHSNPIARGDHRAAPAASFSRLNPNRPGPRLNTSRRRYSAGPLPIEF